MSDGTICVSIHEVPTAARLPAAVPVMSPRSLPDRSARERAAEIASTRLVQSGEQVPVLENSRFFLFFRRGADL